MFSLLKSICFFFSFFSTFPTFREKYFAVGRRSQPPASQPASRPASCHPDSHKPARQPTSQPPSSHPLASQPPTSPTAKYFSRKVGKVEKIAKKHDFTCKNTMFSHFSMIFYDLKKYEKVAKVVKKPDFAVKTQCFWTSRTKILCFHSIILFFCNFFNFFIFFQIL